MVDQKVIRLAKEYIDLLQNAEQTSEQPGEQKITHKPFFTSMSIWNIPEEHRIEVINGGTKHWETPSKISPLSGRIEMRMGDPVKGGSVESVKVGLPRNFYKDALDKEILFEARELFWNCAEDLESKFSDTLGRKRQKGKYIYFSKEKPNQYIGEDKKFDVDLEQLRQTFEKASRELQRPWLKDVELFIQASKKEKYFLNSEGTLIFGSGIQYIIRLDMSAIDEENFVIPHSARWVGEDFSQIPSYEEIMKIGHQTRNELEKILKAPLQRNGEYPVILDAENTGVIAHETTGHGLEGHRLQEGADFIEDKNSLFKGKIGKRIAPSFLSLYDDPLIDTFRGAPVNGHYLFDEEGVSAQKVQLIENGVLKNYLHSRQSAGYFETQSNGHCRASEGIEPSPRMGVLVLDSSKTVSSKKLKEELIKECVRQNKPYGLMLKGSTGGWVIPEESLYNTRPAHIFRVYQDGKTERVQGIHIVGTPYQTLSNITMTGKTKGIFNGYCSAGSGTIPSAEIAPSSLVKSLEVSQIDKDESYMEVYDSPFD